LEWCEGARIGFVGPELLSHLWREVTQRGLPRPNSLSQALAHALNSPNCPDVVVELGEPGQDGFHELPVWVGLDRFRHGNNLDTKFAKGGLDRVVVLDVPCEPVDLPDQQGFNFAALVFAVTQELEELRSIRELGRFTFLDEDLGDG
jgi:hypothetical protein